jgi:hypothetical protein
VVADGFSPIADVIWTLLVIAVFSTLVVSFVAAAVGARQCAEEQRRLSAVFCGCMVGVIAATITGWLLLCSGVLILGLLLCPLVGGGLAYGLARRMASGTTHGTKFTPPTNRQPD